MALLDPVPGYGFWTALPPELIDPEAPTMQQRAHDSHGHHGHMHGGHDHAHGHCAHDHAAHHSRVGPAAVPPRLSAGTKLEWTCPMHPEIARDAPGNCPICGMALEPKTVTLEDVENVHLTDVTRRFWISLALSLPLVAAAMAEMVWGMEFRHRVGEALFPWGQLVLATPVVLLGGWSFFVRGWISFRTLRLNMYSLIGPRGAVAYPFLGLLLSPMIASAAMSLSSVSVIGNALRLRKAAL
jgi:Cu+-exporting ATPase